MGTDSDAPDVLEAPDVPESGLRTGVKSLGKELQYLTSPDGPLVQLVEEVRKSNRLAESNALELAKANRKLVWAVVGLLLSFLVIAGCMLILLLSVGTLADMQSQQTAALDYARKLVDFAAETDKKVEAARTSLDEAPKIVADKTTGRLKIVATMEETPVDAAVTAPVKEKTSKKKRRVASSKSAAKEPPSTPPPAPSAKAPSPSSPPPAASAKSAEPKAEPPPAPKKRIEIPIDMGEMELK